MTHRHNLGRSEKYHALPRTLYALLFDDGGCYVGQSSNPQQREKQHRSPKGGWHRPFRFHALEVVTATRAEAEAYEQAWRVKAHQRRWQLGTPVKAPSERVGWWPWAAVVISVLALARCVTG
ncbi:GIY-YIG nuclease family protein [Stenotrophomonas maltophilia]|uniref:GIY-YIG nuclease family protein n=1 Tax=Stenotrophomonas maltophilia TaxID=40324 RepID=UPI0025568E0D|nr:GIY-YIG nuclease family protein [Stenotrophomonas maltophilia]